jgi:urease accessory protein
VNITDAPEVAAYRDEPAQMPSGVAGKHGVLELTFSRHDSRSVLSHLYRQAPLHAQQALYWDEHLPELACVYMITTSGCVLQGDRLDVRVRLEPGAMAHITTQAATKIHQMDANFGSQSQQLTLADNAYLEFLPGATIPHRHSRFVTQTEVTVSGSATLLFAELLLPGRTHYAGGELFEYDLYSSALSASRPDGTALCSEKLLAQPARYPVRDAGAMGTFNVFANVTVLTPARHAEAILEQVLPGRDEDSECLSGASRLPGDAGLSYKVLGRETEAVMTAVRRFWSLVRREVTGALVPDPRSWG